MRQGWTLCEHQARSPDLSLRVCPGCECLASWTFAGETWHGCANPGNDWSSYWCYIVPASCLPGAWACAIEQGLWYAALNVPCTPLQAVCPTVLSLLRQGLEASQVRGQGTIKVSVRPMGSRLCRDRDGSKLRLELGATYSEALSEVTS